MSNCYSKEKPEDRKGIRFCRDVRSCRDPGTKSKLSKWNLINSNACTVVLTVTSSHAEAACQSSRNWVWNIKILRCFYSNLEVFNVNLSQPQDKTHIYKAKRWNPLE